MKTKNKKFLNILENFDIARKVILNSIFIVFIIGMILFWGFVFIGGKSSSGVSVVNNNSTLVLDFDGVITEQSNLTAIDKMLMSNPYNEYRLFDILKVIMAAKNDSRIEQILIKTDNLKYIGWAQANEIVSSLENFKQSGKKVIAHGDDMNQKQYLIASVADKVYIDQMGSVVIEGLSSYRQYYREALQDKLGIDMHLFKVGDFKSAAEPYIMDHASSEAKESDAYWMGGIWQGYLNKISSLRDLSLDEMNTNILNFKDYVVEHEGDLAMVAMHQGLIDGFATYDQVKSMISKNDNDLIEVSYSSYLNNINKGSSLSKDRVAVLVAEGEIISGKSSSSQMGDESILEMIEKVKNDNFVKAVVIRVNSPGGSVIASEKIRRGINSLKEEGKVVVVSMGDMGASGGYWISMDADYIMAEHSTITGSIGIFGLVPNFSRGLEKIGVYTDGVATSPLAGSFSPTRPLQEDASIIIENVIKNGYEQFIEKVASARDMNIDETNDVAKGRVWTGLQAHQRGLIDEIGGLNNAIVHAREMVGLNSDNSDVFIVETKPSSIEKFLFGASISISKIFNKDISSLLLGSLIPQQNKSDIDFMMSVIEDSSSPSSKIKTYAHCLCEI